VTLYGIAEIAETLGVTRNLVALWHHRGKLPPPDQVLKAGPVWTGETIGPWLRSKRKEM
jgi:predicted site-specific integrase-resolvase